MKSDRNNGRFRLLHCLADKLLRGHFTADSGL
jgi:hypothetical protein